jgi:hypothetical protein
MADTMNHSSVCSSLKSEIKLRSAGNKREEFNGLREEKKRI